MSLSPVSPTGKKLKTMDDGRSEGARSSQQRHGSEPRTDIADISNEKEETDNQAPMTIAGMSAARVAAFRKAFAEVKADMAKAKKEAASADKDDVKTEGEPSNRPTTSSDSAQNNTNTKSSHRSSRDESQSRRNHNHPPQDELSTNDDGDEDMLPAGMHDADPESDADMVGLVVFPDNPYDSDTTSHSVDQEEMISDSNEDSIDDMILVDGMSDTDTDDSSGYLGYENAVAGGYLDHDDDSLDEESDNSEAHDAINYCLPEEYLKYDPTPDNPYPQPDWTTLNELMARKRGFTSSRQLRKRQNMFWFERYASNSLWMVQRLQVVRKLSGHTGCVNSFGFNSTANLLCSGSDDLSVCIWDWQKETNHPMTEIPTGHNNNVFQSVFCNRDTNIVTSSRDGSVRLLDIETQQNERLMSSSGEIQKLAFISEDTFLTCGTNASVDLIDLRSRESRRLFTVKSPKTNQTFQLHSIESHPLDKHLIAVGGKSPYVFLYDLRRLPRELHDPEIKPTYSLGNLDNSFVRVTSTAFNSTGDKLLISYNDDDLYVCRTDTCEVIHKYQGHRNRKTYKGCAWFGDNFVLSGSDDGHIYGWDLESEHIVCFLKADSGIVNCLLVHPTLPMLASSGLEDNIKIWEPVASQWPQTMKGIKPQICKNTMRRKLAKSCVSVRYG